MSIMTDPETGLRRVDYHTSAREGLAHAGRMLEGLGNELRQLGADIAETGTPDGSPLAVPAGTVVDAADALLQAGDRLRAELAAVAATLYRLQGVEP